MSATACTTERIVRVKTEQVLVRPRKGSVREDGKVFVGIRKSCVNDEYWISAERFAEMRLAEVNRAVAVAELRRAKSKLRKANNLRYAPASSFRKTPLRFPSKITQKCFDNIPYGTHSTPDMTNQIEMTIIPNYSKYGITRDGVVTRVIPAARGRTAGVQHRVKPVIHPRGHQWCVQITGDDGVRKRIPITQLVKLIFGEPETIS